MGEREIEREREREREREIVCHSYWSDKQLKSLEVCLIGHVF